MTSFRQIDADRRGDRLSRQSIEPIGRALYKGSGSSGELRVCPIRPIGSVKYDIAVKPRNVFYIERY